MSTDTLASIEAPPIAALVREPAPLRPAPRVVLKIGTSSLVTDGRLDPAKVETLCETVCRGVQAGLAPVLVTSGAIAIGRTRHPALAGGTAAAQQVAAALGQGTLYGELQAAFARRGLVSGQLLLTPRDLTEPNGEAGVRETLETMLELGMVPIVNENDALGVRNNDVLAALLGGFLGASLLLLLTNVPGLYDSNPLLGDARLIARVPRLTPALEALAGGSVGDGGTGGMMVKLAACWIATYAGVRAVIADTTDPQVLVDAARGAAFGTSFEPLPVPGADLGRLWRTFRTPPAGALTCTEAGVRAIGRGEPLLPAHIATTSGALRDGDVVDLLDGAARVLARGALRPDAGSSAAGAPLLAIGDYVRIVED
jgi:glutamate 5-kinase